MLVICYELGRSRPIVGETVIAEKPVFIISDLHIGDGSEKDNLRSKGREKLLYYFLEHVSRQNGELIIVGDFLELWRHPMDAIIDNRRPLLDSLCSLDVTYIPGNHDSQVLSYVGSQDVPHAFFACVRPPFCREIGQTRFKFMHGHEVDPFIPADSSTWTQIFGTVSRVLGPNDACALSSDRVSEMLLEIGERLLGSWHWLCGRVDKTIHDCCSIVPNEGITSLTRGLRTRKMLARYHHDRTRGFYDIAVVGHTHRAGRFADWYFNSGSWTGSTNDFLRISPDGSVHVFEMIAKGAVANDNVIAA